MSKTFEAVFVPNVRNFRLKLRIICLELSFNFGDAISRPLCQSLDVVLEANERINIVASSIWTWVHKFILARNCMEFVKAIVQCSRIARVEISRAYSIMFPAVQMQLEQITVSTSLQQNQIPKKYIWAYWRKYPGSGWAESGAKDR